MLSLCKIVPFAPSPY